MSFDFAWGITAGLALAALEVFILKIVEYCKGDDK